MRKRSKIKMLSHSHPAQIWGVGLLALGLSCAAIMLLMEKIRPDIAASVRASTADVVAPVSKLLSTPKQSISNLMRDTVHFFNALEENKQLRQEKAELLKWQYAAEQSAKENEQLRGLLRVVPEGQPNYITAQMVGAFGQQQKHVALISAGLEDGVKEDRAVIGAEGLIGRVIEISKKNARVLLITDINANIPVSNQRSSAKAILTGHRGRAELKLDLAEKPELFQVGDRLVTSGDGGMIPPGIPVASITSIQGNSIFATPIANPEQSSVVTVVDFQF